MNDRDYVYIRGQPIRHTTAERDWRCGACESKLVTRPYPNDAERRIEWRTVCSRDESHSTDGFIHQHALQQRRHRMGIYQAEYDLVRKERNMTFVKDRHTEDGDIVAQPKVRRTGRISLGEKTDRGARALPYFIIKIDDGGDTEEFVINQVHAALEQYAPGQDLDHPKVLPVFFPATDLFLMARSDYKLAGTGGRPRCVGDGESIQFKLGPNNLIEINGGQVNVELLDIDGTTFKRDASVPCPGMDHRGRWQHCEKCRLVFQIDLQIAGLPYIWQLSTGDQDFYTQFFTVYKKMNEHVRQGDATYLTEIPLLLRREPGVKGRPEKVQQGTAIRWTEMPLLSIEIHPIWLQMVMYGRVKALGNEEAPRSLPGPVKTVTPATPEVAPTKWHERVKVELPERPWRPEDVLKFLTLGMDAYRDEVEDADSPVPGGIKEACYGFLLPIYAELLSDEDAPDATHDVLEYLFGGDIESKAQAAVVYHWAREEMGGKARQAPHFKEEAIRVFDVAATTFSDIIAEENGEVLPDAEQFGGEKW